MVKVVLTALPGGQERASTIRMLSKNTSHGELAALTLTVTRVPGGPDLGLILMAMADAGDADSVRIEVTSTATMKMDVYLPPASTRRLVLIWATPHLVRW